MTSGKRAGRPTTEETEQLNERILQAAFEVFAREGFSGATIEQIAQESGTTRRSVLNRFRDKESLLFTVVEAWLWRTRRNIWPPLPALSAKPLDALRQVCDQMLQYMVTEEAVSFYRLCIAQAPRFPAIASLFIRVNDQVAQDLEDMVRRAQREGSFPGRDASMVATGLIGVFVSNPLNRTAIGDPQFRDPPRRQAYFDGLWKFVLDNTAV